MTSLNPKPNTLTPKLYGRRKGRPLSSDLKEAVGALGHLGVSRDKILAAADGALTPQDLFGKPHKQYWLEIGFGAGDFLAGQAALHPDTGIVGCEAYENGVAKCLQKLLANKSQNARIYNDDARHLLPKLRDGSFTRAFLLFPDPWPKKRHAKRRFVRPENLREIARLLSPGGEFWIATDDPVYKEWCVEQIGAQNFFRAPSPLLSKTPPQPWFETGYQRKAQRAGRVAEFTVLKKQ